MPGLGVFKLWASFNPTAVYASIFLIWTPVTLVRFTGWPQGSCHCEAGVRHERPGSNRVLAHPNPRDLW